MKDLSLFHMYNTIVHIIEISTYVRGQAIVWFFVSTFSVQSMIYVFNTLRAGLRYSA